MATAKITVTLRPATWPITSIGCWMWKYAFSLIRAHPAQFWRIVIAIPFMVRHTGTRLYVGKRRLA